MNDELMIVNVLTNDPSPPQDSAHFFRPRHFRTSVYHEILLGYLDYMKKLGYTLAHIWACPPSEGDDYIFHCHPPVSAGGAQVRLVWLWFLPSETPLIPS